MKHGIAVIVALGMLSPTAGCATRSAEDGAEYVGTWTYDRVSLRDEALASAIESVAGDEPKRLTDAERAEIEAWVHADHDRWDKTIVIEGDGTFRAISKVGDGRAETIGGTWSVRDGEAVFLESDGERMARARIESGRLVMLVGERETSGEVVAAMVMLPASEAE